MIFQRKRGETHKQFFKRLDANIQVLLKDNENLSKQLFDVCNDTDVMNPKTLRLYREEAQELFNTVALIEMFLRNGEVDNVVGMLYGQLTALGFTEYEIMTNEALKDGSYNIRNKVDKK